MTSEAEQTCTAIDDFEAKIYEGQTDAIRKASKLSGADLSEVLSNKHAQLGAYRKVTALHTTSRGKEVGFSY